MSNREKIQLLQEEVICWALVEFGIDPKELYKQRYAIDEASNKLMQIIEPETIENGTALLINVDDDLPLVAIDEEQFFGQMKGAEE